MNIAKKTQSKLYESDGFWAILGGGVSAALKINFAALRK